ncbi:MAG TPA: efflux RND transporter permease subunit [Phnomibacter sp.]|nr:efflux RND transporter permease subunit [Phnomibacter sp.]
MSEFFIRRPIVAIVISKFTVLLGFLTLRGIPIAQYPEIVPPMIKITGTYNGANAVNVEQTTATPIEQQVNGVENMLYMQSINGNDGTTTINVSFEVGTNLDNANMLTQNRVAMANPFLPNDVKAMGVNTKKALAFPLMIISLYSPKATYDARFVVNYCYINVIDQIKRIKGVGDVVVFGGSEYAIRIWLKPDRMSAYNISVNDVKKAMSQYNNIYPGGSFGNNPALPGVQNTYTAQLQSRLSDPNEFSKIIIKSDRTGASVKLSDIARVELGTENFFQNSRLNKQNAGAIAIYQIPGSNAIDVAEEIKKTMTELESRFPQDMAYRVSLDTTIPIEVGIEEIMHTLFEAVLLVILVVFIFLQDWRATLIPLLTVPVSLVGVFIFFPLMGFSVNVLSLLGLVLAIGLVVDDAIVVVEAVMHHMEHGKSPKEATQIAMKEVAGPVIAIAIILAAVFIPVALMPGITGRLYQQFAITIAVSVLLSAFNALTLSPALAAMILKPKNPNAKGLLTKFFGWFNRGFDKFTNGYVKVAGFFARKLVISLIVLGGIVFGAGYFTKAVPGGFVPEEDNGYFIMGIFLPDAASFERTDAVSRKVEDILANTDGIESYTLINGFNIMNQVVSPNTSTLFVQLKDWSERKTDKEILRELNVRLAKEITEATAIAVGPPAIPGLGTGAGFTMQIQDRAGGSPQELARQTQRFIMAARERPEIGSILSLFRSDVPQKSIKVDKDKVEKTGLTLDEVNSTISTMLGGSFVNNFNAFGRQYRTYMQADAEFRMKPNDLEQIYIRDAKGSMVSLGTLARVTDTTGPQYTNRFNLYRSAEVSGTPAPGYSSAQALRALEEVAAQTLPSTIGYQWSNMSFQEKSAEGKSAQVFGMALLFVFLILAAQYESWKLPFSVLLGTPWAVMGAMLGLWLARLMLGESYVNNVFAQIGLVMLIGLNAKNAILIVEFAKMKMEEGQDAFSAAIDGAKLRFRPILMTSFAFILGVVPLLTAYGAGAEARKVMGMAVFAGMITATTIGVILIPSFFVLIERKKKKDKLAAAVPPPAANDHGHETSPSA